MPSFPLPRPGFLVAVAVSLAAAVGVALDAPQPAGARERTFLVKLSDGTLKTVTLDVPDGTPLAAIPLPGTLVKEETLAPPAGQPTGPSSSPSDAQRAGQGSGTSPSTAGAVGWMQFLPSTWARYGVDANGDGKRDPYNPVDAIFAAASYLKAAGGDKDIKKAIFAYNHAGWYVDSVMLRAKLIAGVPGDLIGSLTGLTEGRFPVAAHARYADDPAQHPGQAGASIAIYSGSRAPVVAVNDGVVKKIGADTKRGRYLMLQDAYGNSFSYTGLGSVVHVYPLPKVNRLQVPVA